MINEVYLESEENIWVDGHLRITPNRLIEIISQGELLLALNQDFICGCIHLEKRYAKAYKPKMGLNSCRRLSSNIKKY